MEHTELTERRAMEHSRPTCHTVIVNGLNSSQSKKHALVIPLSFQSHVAGIYRLAVELAKRGVTITFMSLSQDVSQFRTYEELEGLDFNLVSYDPSLKQPNRFGKFKDLEDFLDAKRDHFQPILEDLKVKQKAGLSVPTCIIYDFFCTWVKNVAKELNIPHYTYFSAGAILARFFQETPRLFSDGTLVIKEDTTLLEFDGSVEVPGLPPLLYSEIPLSTRQSPHVSISIGQTMANADGLIVNTFYELECPQIDEIQRQLAEHSTGRKVPNFFPIGPISHANTFKDRYFLHTSGLNNRGIDSLQWLDNQQPQSVLYICIGSMGRWNPAQVYELALALEAVEQSFLWVVQTGVHLPSLEEALPPGFEERTRGKGLIVSRWVPQLQILSHSSVGGFLTHCGWNSMVESVSSGVPTIGWPQGAEQHLNLRHFVEVLKVAVQVGCLTPPGSLIRHEEFEKAVRLLMVEEEGQGMRSRVHQLMLRAKAAVGDGGSSKRALSEVADSIPSEAIRV